MWTVGIDLNCGERFELWGEMWTVRRDVDCGERCGL